jgi:hypothetical protein
MIVGDWSVVWRILFLVSVFIITETVGSKEKRSVVVCDERFLRATMALEMIYGISIRLICRMSH